MMYWDLKVLVMSLRILKEKLILYHHISCLLEDTLANRILETMKQHQLIGLHDEVPTLFC